MKNLFLFLLSVALSVTACQSDISNDGNGATSSFDPELAITIDSLSFDAEGGTQTIAVAANCEYEISTTADWVSYTKTDEGVIITVPYYVDVEERSADITISIEQYNFSKVVAITQNGLSEEAYAKHCIVYTSSDGKVVEYYVHSSFGANVISNTYEGDKGIIKFDGPVTKIDSYAFRNNNNLISMIIPDGVTSIGYSAFYNCTNLESVTIPDSVTDIGVWAFYDCRGLTGVTIPNSVASIGNKAFCGCSKLASVTIPDSVTSVGYAIFCQCKNLEAFYGKYASSDNRCLIVDGVLNSFAPLGLTSYDILDSVTSIGESAFDSVGTLKSVTIPNSVTSIEKNGFYYCYKLSSIVIPSSITSIATSTFGACSGLKSVTIPDSVTSIGDEAFHRCYELPTITIPASVTSIGQDAFSGCYKMESVYCQAATPPAGGEDMLSAHLYYRLIYVPRNSVDAYKSAEYWSDYADYIAGYEF